ncbi:MAG: SDR family NAD(P)-dependent oxidoreductase [Anaerolineales bacterium]|jgi:NAD(P)-dependent dehydrogenase (short-subunit alcohol dehydrogenase family)
MSLKDKVAIITGGGRGIGRAIAKGFGEQGAQVVVAARTRSELDQVVEELNSNGAQALAVTCDVSDEDQVAHLIHETKTAFGGVDILVNNAGVGNIRPVYAIPKGSFERVLGVNLVGTFLCTKHVWKLMEAADGGVIINVSSMGGLEGYPYLSAYCASKWGQIGFTKACAEEGKAVGIRVNAIAPGKGDTAFRAQINEDKSQLLSPEDHVGVCIFLASDASRYITGQVIPIEWFGPEDQE